MQNTRNDQIKETTAPTSAVTAQDLLNAVQERMRQLAMPSHKYCAVIA